MSKLKVYSSLDGGKPKLTLIQANDRMSVVGSLVIRVVVSATLLAGATVSVAEAFSDKDIEIAEAAWTKAEKGALEAAFEHAAKAEDPLVAKLFKWIWIVRPDQRPEFPDIAAFLEDNPGWPYQGLLRYRAEEAIPPELDTTALLQWFNRHPPEGAVGKMRLGEALLAAGRSRSGEAILKDAWITENFNADEERAFYDRHKDLLDNNDHIQRLDRLVWDERFNDARRMYRRVEKGYRNLTEARIILHARKNGVDAAISQVPKSLHNDPGLIYERIRWRRLKGLEDSARDLLLDAPKKPPHAEIWWRERHILARDALQKGFITEAYKLTSEHGIPSSESTAYSQAEWLSGWIALRFLHDADIALGHFTRMHASVSYPISLARGAYWSGRAAYDSGKPEMAREWFKKAAAYSTTYYGQLAATRIEPEAVFIPPSVERPGPDLASALESSELAQVATLLQDIEADTYVRPFLFALADSEDSAAWKMLAARFAVSIGRVDLAVAIARRSSLAGIDLYVEGFPVLWPPALPDTVDLPPVEIPLVLAVIRQESAFSAEARSSAGARGLMQLMPRTASRVANQLQLNHSRRKLIEDPDHNLVIGQTYLAKMLSDFEGSYVLAMCAYNAGPSRARSWVMQYGDPRDPTVDVVDWVEQIPFGETRNYVQRILEGLQVYRARMSAYPAPIQIDRDLKR